MGERLRVLLGSVMLVLPSLRFMSVHFGVRVFTSTGARFR